MIKLTSRLEEFRREDIEKLKKKWDGQYFDVAADMLLLSYTKKAMQKLLKEESASKEIFIAEADKILPMGFGSECHHAWKDIRERGWKYLAYVEDKASGFEAVAYYKGRILVAAIAGSDNSTEDWIDNDARLIVAKGSLVPTQFRIVRKKLLSILEKYEAVCGRKPKELLIAGNSLGGAVSVVGYTELFFPAMEQGISMSVLAYNSAPVRLEYLETVLRRNELKHGAGLTAYGLRKYYNSILHFINEDDLLNNILSKLIRNLDTFGHIGRFLIIENKGEEKETDMLHYAKEHISIQALRSLQPAEVQDIGFHAKNMVDDSKAKFRRNLRSRVEKDIGEYNRRVALLDKIRGALLGVALGDLYGHKGSGTGDATGMTLAVARGFLEDPEDPERFIGGCLLEWYALDRKEVGKTTATAIEEAIKIQDFPTGAKKAHGLLQGRTAGNASLKRAVPAALLYGSLRRVIAMSGLQSNMTHFDHEAKEACQLYAWLVHLLLDGVEKEAALEDVFGSHLHYWQYKTLGTESIKGGRYVADCLLDALIVFNKAESFEDGLEMIAELSGGREFGPVAGGLLGAAYGKKAIGFKQSGRLQEKVEILEVAGQLYDKRMKER